MGGVLDPACPYIDLQTAVSELQRKLSRLDSSKMESIRSGVQKVMGDVENLLSKKAELDKKTNGGAVDHDHDKKVNELFELCHSWSSTAASLPAVVSRLQSLQALHQESESFASRLGALDSQQQELAKLLETTNASVGELGKHLKENVSAIMENMKALEQKMAKAK